MTAEAPIDPPHQPNVVDMGPYGPRGQDTPPFVNMLGGYAIIFGVVLLAPLILFILFRFVIL